MSLDAEMQAAFDEEAERHNRMGEFAAHHGFIVGSKVKPPPLADDGSLVHEVTNADLIEEAPIENKEDLYRRYRKLAEESLE